MIALYDDPGLKNRKKHQKLCNDRPFFVLSLHGGAVGSAFKHTNKPNHNIKKYEI